MKTPLQPTRFLDRPEMLTIHRNALRILGEIGMTVDHEEALQALSAIGCLVDFDRRHVRFPENVTQQCVDKMQRDFASRREPERLAFRYSQARFRHEPYQVHEDFSVSAGGYCVFIYDLHGVRRPGTLNDTRQALKLVQQLDGITYSGLPVCAQDVPLPMRQICMAAELVKHTDKLGGIEALNVLDIKYISRIGQVVRGSRAELLRRPILVGYAEARSPLCLDQNMCEVMVEYIKQGLPQSLDTVPNAGFTAPMHPAGTLALGFAETLAGVVLAYAIDPSAVVTIDVTPAFSDMSTGILKYSGSERVSLLGARIQMLAEFYGCPSGVHGGKTDACVPDMRCGVEKGISMLMPVLCGAVGFGTVGHIENAVTFSPLQLVLDNEIVRYVRRAVRGFEVTDETIHFESIRRVGIGGSYLDEPDTSDQFREWLNLSPFFRTEAWGSRGSVDANEDWLKRGREKAFELLENEVPSPLTPDQIAAVDEIVSEAESDMRQQGLL